MRKVRLVQQSTAVDCAAACLAMVLNHHGHGVSLRDVRDRTGVGRDGLSARDIMRAARGYGLKTRAFSLEPQAMAGKPLPAIAHWRFEHFVVVEAWTPRQVTIVDPAAGRMTLSRREFARDFTGVLLTFEPGPGFTRQPRARGWWHSPVVRAAVRDKKALFAQIIAASALLQVMGLLLPAASGVITDRVLPGGDEGLLAFLGIMLAVGVLTHLAVGQLRTLLLAMLRTRVDGEMTEGIVAHLMALPYRFFALRGAGDLVTRTASLAQVRALLSGQIVAAMLDGPMAAGYLVLLLAMEPSFGLGLIMIAGLEILALLLTQRRVGELITREQIAQADAQTKLIESIKGMENLKAAGAEQRALSRWREAFARQLAAAQLGGLTAGSVTSATATVRFAAPAAFFWMGAWQVLSGDLSLGQVLALNAIAVAALTPLGSLMGSLHQLQTVGAHVERLDDIAATPRETFPVQAERPSAVGFIRLRDVSFRYDQRSPWILRNIYLSISPGEKIALVGSSGSGKSTLARLLLGLYQPDEGEIFYNGQPASQIDIRHLRTRFGIVNQEPVLFSGSIRENICLNDPDASYERMVRAARLAHIHDTIDAMPMKYETMLTDGGLISGGQRQRIALARALLTEPAVLLLDEATSHLDTRTEAIIEHNLSHLPITRIVIAHRLSTVRDAARIFVIDKGSVAEVGDHDHLMSRRGRYAALVGHDASAAITRDQS
ncbi:peptidase domain-containing ABC transporter [Nonomuraea sp. NPDC004354]